MFSEIHTIDSHSGEEEFNDMFGYTWDEVKSEFEKNTRHFDNIVHWNKYSYEVDDKFSNNEFDFLYIDANHSYDGVKRDLELYIPKVKKGGVIAGHDYVENWVGVRKAVDESFGSPDKTYMDGSWIKYI